MNNLIKYYHLDFILDLFSITFISKIAYVEIDFKKRAY